MLSTTKVRYWIFGFHKILESSWVAAQLAASQESLRFMRLISLVKL
jgi:hypothetical protein